jgi:hypothetical protein
MKKSVLKIALAISLSLSAVYADKDSRTLPMDKKYGVTIQKVRPDDSGRRITGDGWTTPLTRESLGIPKGTWSSLPRTICDILYFEDREMLRRYIPDSQFNKWYRSAGAHYEMAIPTAYLKYILWKKHYAGRIPILHPMTVIYLEEAHKPFIRIALSIWNWFTLILNIGVLILLWHIFKGFIFDRWVYENRKSGFCKFLWGMY